MVYALFIDDNLRNVKAGEQLGMKGIHFQSASQLQVSLQELGIYWGSVHPWDVKNSGVKKLCLEP